MRKITKTLITLFLTAIMCMTSLPVFASEYQNDRNQEITPRLSHTYNSDFSFNATTSGGHAVVTYYGNESFVKADLTIKVEKCFLWVFWSQVDEWSSSSTQKNGDFLHTFTLTGSATYRATFTLKITGSDGTVDTIEQVIESKY